MSANVSGLSIDEKVKALKKKIVWFCDADLSAAVDGPRKEIEGQLLLSLERIIDRVNEASRDPAPSYGADSSIPPERQVSMTVFKCQKCGNNNASYLVRDGKSGDTICLGVNKSGCGMILQDHTVDEGSEKRNFEDSEDRNHHGSVPDPLMPDHINLETRSMAPLHSHSMSMSKFKQYVADNQRIEREVMDVHHDDRRTTVYYKAHHKKEVFALMNEMAYNLNLHDQVVAVAKIIFSRYREAKERVQQESAVVAACLVLAYLDILKANITSNRYTASSNNSDIKFVDESNAYDTGNYEAQLITLMSEADADKALKCLKDKPVVQWTDSMLRDWVFEVLSDMRKPVSFITLLSQSFCTALRPTNLSHSEPPVKRLRTSLNDLPPLFGTTTAAGRNKLQQQKQQSREKETALSAGQLFTRANIRQVLFEISNPAGLSIEDLADVEEVLKSARGRRLAFEVRRDKIVLEAERETQRLKVAANNSSASRALLSYAGNGNSNVSVMEEVNNDGLSELLGEVVASSSSFRSGTAQVKNEKSESSPVKQRVVIKIV